VLSVALTQRHLGEAAAAEAVEEAVTRDLAAGYRGRTTTQIGDSLAAAVA
jgi:hypothetical protein